VTRSVLWDDVDDRRGAPCTNASSPTACAFPRRRLPPRAIVRAARDLIATPLDP
jgi:hypothetical protein